MHALTVESLRKRYDGQEVVKGISFSVAAGECFGLLGPNGAGKTDWEKVEARCRKALLGGGGANRPVRL